MKYKTTRHINKQGKKLLVVYICTWSQQLHVQNIKCSVTRRQELNKKLSLKSNTQE